MRPAHLLLALLIALVWGFNFIAIRLGAQGWPPLLLATLRYVFTAIPLVFFLPRPPVAWSRLVAYGVIMGAAQFGLLFLAVGMGLPTGLASLVLQAQAMFTMGLAALLLGERPGSVRIVGALIAFSGLALIGIERVEGDAALAPFLMCLGAAMCWAVGNIINRGVGRVEPVGFIAWTSLFAAPPLLVASLIVDGPATVAGALTHVAPAPLAALAYIVLAASLIGASAWSYLMTLYPAGVVAPFSLLVPVVGLAAGAAFMGERFTANEATGVAIVAAGLALNVFGPRLAARLRRA